MNFLNQYRGHLICAGLGILVGALLVLWIKKDSKPQVATSSPVVDKPAPVQPQFRDTVPSWVSTKRDTTWHYKSLNRLGGSIGETEGAAIDTLTKPTIAPAVEPQPAESRPESSPCKPFSLRLKSSPTSLSSVLDSVVVDYFYPSGMHNFEYYNRPQKDNSNAFFYPKEHLTFGVQSLYQTYQSKLSFQADCRIRLGAYQIVGGYRVVGNSHPTWILGGRKEFVIF